MGGMRPGAEACWHLREPAVAGDRFPLEPGGAEGGPSKASKPFQHSSPRYSPVCVAFVTATGNAHPRPHRACCVWLERAFAVWSGGPSGAV